MAKVLLVEDDKNLLDTVVEWLRFEHYTVESVSNGDEGLALLESYKYDLIVLDWQLPGLSGIEICRRFRDKGGQTPILFLTGRGTMPDKEAGYDAGADDYLTKPFHMKELSLRLRSLLRRSGGVISQDSLSAAHITLNPKTYEVKCEGRDVHLAPMEFAVLEFFMRNPKQVFSTEAILQRVWSSSSERSSETLRTCLKKLRDKIAVEGRESVIKNIHGVGYKFDADS